LDSRLYEKDRGRAIDYLMEETDTRVVIPMHMWDKYEVCDEFVRNYPQYRDNFEHIYESGQVITI